MSTPHEVSTPSDAPELAGPNGAGSRRSRLMRWAPVLVILVAWMAHEGARRGTWVLEDAPLVRDDPDVARGPQAIPRLLADGWRDSETASGAYGPLVVSSFALEAPLWRRADGTLAPTGFHLVNLLLHGLCALLLFRVLVRLLPNRPVVGLAAALCFATHPLHVGTVAPLMGRGELLATLFSLLAVLAWRAWGGRNPGWIPATALLWLLALLSKEIALGLPLVLWGLDRALPPTADDADAGASRWVRQLAYAVFVVPFVIFLISWDGLGPASVDIPRQGVGERLAVGFEGLGRGALQLAVPVGLRADHTDEAVPGLGYQVSTPGLILIALMCALTLFVGLRLVRGRCGQGGVVWLLFLALAIPALLVSRAGASLEARFAYLVAMPLFAIAGMLIESLASRAGRMEPFSTARAVIATGIALACFAGLSQREAAAWRDDVTFHDRLLDRNPQHVRAMIRLARFQRKAAAELQAAAGRLPVNTPRHTALLNQRMDALAIATSWASRATQHELGARSSDAWREFGFAQLGNDRGPEALRAFERALDLDTWLREPPERLQASGMRPRLVAAAEIYHAIGICREVLGERDTAADAFFTAARLMPDEIKYTEKAGLALCRIHRYAEGINLLRRALRRSGTESERERLKDGITQARKSAKRIGARYMREGDAARDKADYREAVGHYERAIEVNPRAVGALIQAGWLRGWYFGQYTQAHQLLDRAEKLLDPDKTGKNERLRRLIDGYRKRLVEQKREEDEEEH